MNIHIGVWIFISLLHHEISNSTICEYINLHKEMYGNAVCGLLYECEWKVEWKYFDHLLPAWVTMDTYNVLSHCKEDGRLSKVYEHWGYPMWLFTSEPRQGKHVSSLILLYNFHQNHYEFSSIYHSTRCLEIKKQFYKYNLACLVLRACWWNLYALLT